MVRDIVIVFYVALNRNIDYDKSECDEMNEGTLYNIVSAVSGGNDKFLVRVCYFN